MSERSPNPGPSPSPALRRGAALLASGLRRLGIRNQPVVAAFSGGADSLGMLILLGALPKRLRPAVEAVHVDHGLRLESAQDAERAVALARSLGVACSVVRLPPVEEGRGGVEAWARRGRYAALAEVAGGRPILTAHTADDQAETILYRLAKGSGTLGAAGISPRVRLAGALIVRPLLEVDRAMLRQVVEERGLEPVEDPSNQRLDFVRNRLRHRVLPALEEAIPGATRNLARAARHAGADERFLARRTERAIQRLQLPGGGVDARGLLGLPAALRGRVVRGLVLAAGGRLPSAARVEEILAVAEEGGETHLPGGIRAVARGGRLEVGPGPTGRRAGIQTAPRASGRRKQE